MPTLEGTVQRLALNQSMRSGMVDVLSQAKVELWRGTTAKWDCALFKGVPSATTLVNSVGNIVAVDLIIRRRNAQGPVIITSTLDSTDVDLTLTWADWIAALDEHFSFELSAAQTNQTIPNSGTLPIYYSVYITTATHKYLAGFGYGDIIESGLMDPSTLPPPPILPPYELSIPLFGTSATFSGTVSGAIGVFGNLSGTVGPSGLAGLNYWNVEWSGVDTTGATDTTAEFNNAREIAFGIGGALWAPKGSIIQISEELTVSNPELWVGDGTENGTGFPGVTLMWTGPEDGTMLAWFEVRRGGGIRGFSFDGNGTAGICILTDGSIGGYFRQMRLFGFKECGWKHTAHGPNFNNSWNTYDQIAIDGDGGGNSCLWLSGSSADGANTCHNTWNNLAISSHTDIARGPRPGIRLGYCDNNRIIGYWFNGDAPPTTTGAETYGVYADSTEYHDTRFPIGNVILHTVGVSWFQDAGLIGINTVLNYGKSNGELDPILNGGHLIWSNEIGDYHIESLVVRGLTTTDSFVCNGTLLSSNSITCYNNFFAQNPNTNSNTGFIVAASDYGSTFGSVNFSLGDNAYAEAPPYAGSNWIRTGALGMVNISQFVFYSNNNISFVFAPLQIEALRINNDIISFSKGLRLPHFSDAAAPVDSTYFSTTSGKPAYKDSGGSTHVLY